MSEETELAQIATLTEVPEKFLPQILLTGDARGGKPHPLEFSVTRELTLEDLTRLDEPKGSVAEPIKSIRNSHHQLAHLLAKGHSATMVSAMVGVTQSRISILKQSPAFANLIEFYQKRETEILLDTTRRLSTLGNEAISVLQERLEDDPETVSNGTLVDIGKFALDRSGHGPTSTQLNIDVPLSSDAIAKLMESAKENQSGKVTIIDVRATEVPPEAQDNSEPERSKTGPQPLALETEVIPLSNSEGPSV